MMDGRFGKNRGPGEIACPVEGKLTSVLANVTPEGRYQRGGIIEDTVDVRRPSINSRTQQVDIGRFTMDGVTIA